MSSKPKPEPKTLPKPGELWRFVKSTNCLVMIENVSKYSISYFRYPELSNAINLNKYDTTNLNSFLFYARKES
jgi:hypothetical protein